MGSSVSTMVEWINELSRDMFLGDGLLTRSLSEGIPALYQYAQAANGVVMPIGYTILGVFFLLELTRCATKADSSGGGGMLGVQMIAGVLIRLGLCKVLIDHTGTILSAIFDGMGYITTQVAGVVALPASPAFPEMQLSWWDNILLSMPIVGMAAGLTYLIPALIVLILMAVAWIRSRLMIFTRFIEAYLYLIISPVPLATLTGGEWSQIGKNFLKNFAAVALQGTLLYLLMAFFPILVGAVNGVLTGVGILDTSISALGSLMMQAFYAVLLTSLMSGVTQLAKSVCSAM